MLRLVYRVGDALARLDRHPRAYVAASFAVIWIGVALGLHFIPRWYGGASFTFGWADAVLTGVVVALVGTIFVFAALRPRR